MSLYWAEYVAHFKGDERIELGDSATNDAPKPRYHETEMGSGNCFLDGSMK